MSNVVQFPSLDDERPNVQPIDVAALIREIEGEQLPAEDQLADLLESLNQLDFSEACKQRIDLDYAARERFPDETGEPPFWAEQYNVACSEIEEAATLIRRAKTRLAFTLWYAFPISKPIRADWMDAHVGKAHKAIQFQTFWTREGDFFVSACKLYDGRWIEYSDAEMALIGLVLKDNGFQRYDSDGENGPQWFIRGEIGDARKEKITKELEQFDFLAITWEDVTH
ncbi:hypothetical protein NKY66_10860 [Sinorhizobium meliloti]|uniref:hypothetical protein n=1 Tax=Rhizobium meliloti TaxID=382 RepID=UPI003D652D87